MYGKEFSACVVGDEFAFDFIGGLAVFQATHAGLGKQLHDFGLVIVFNAFSLAFYPLVRTAIALLLEVSQRIGGAV